MKRSLLTVTLVTLFAVPALAQPPGGAAAALLAASPAASNWTDRQAPQPALGPLLFQIGRREPPERMQDWYRLPSRPIWTISPPIFTGGHARENPKEKGSYSGTRQSQSRALPAGRGRR